MAEKDLYKVLGVSRNASKEDIRKAYRKLARKLHPDVNPGDKKAEERFKDVSFAYDVLSEPEKRKLYDEFGVEGVQPGFNADAARAQKEWARQGGFGFAGSRPGQGGASSFGGFEDVFSDLFGGARARRTHSGPTPRRGRDVQQSVEVELLEAVRGTRRKVAFRRASPCDGCGGAGGEGQAPCPECGGRGTIQTGVGPIAMGRDCLRCSGTGAVPSRSCSACGGRGHRETTERLNVRIPPGVDEGTRIRLAGKGEGGTAGGPPGDLFIVVRVRKHPFVQREGKNLVLDLPVTVAEATLGATVRAPTPHGDVSLRIPPGTQSGQRLRLRGKGVPGKSGASPGDLYVRVQVKVPEVNGEDVRSAVEALDKHYGGDLRKDMRL